MWIMSWLFINCRALQCRWLITHCVERCCKWLVDSQLQTEVSLKLSYTLALWCKPWETTNCCSLCTLSLQMLAAWPYVYIPVILLLDSFSHRQLAVFTAQCSCASTVFGVVILSVSPSVTRALWLIQRTYLRYFYTTWKGNLSSFLPPNSGWWATSPST